MNNQTWQSRIILVVLALIVASSIAGACTAQKIVIVDRTITITNQPSVTSKLQPVTLTVTVTKTLTTTVQGVVQTITMQPEVFTPIFERPAPEIPHPYIIDNEHTGLDLYEEGVPVCFECHLKPVEHEKWLWDAEVCEDCHKVSSNPIIKRY